jgi:hypothetical protein
VGKTVIVGGLTLASGLLGFLIQWLVPVQALTDGKGMEVVIGYRLRNVGAGLTPSNGAIHSPL